MGACFSTEQPKKQPNEHQYIRFEANNQNGQKPLCCFAPNCNQTNPDHNLEFSHDLFNYNGTIALKEQCRKVYPPPSSQSLLGGGCASSFQEKLDESLVKNSGCCIITGGSIVFVVEKRSGKLNFPCGKCKPNEKSLPCAGRETNEELGFNPFQNGIRNDHMWTFVKSHNSLKTGKSRNLLFTCLTTHNLLIGSSGTFGQMMNVRIFL